MRKRNAFRPVHLSLTFLFVALSACVSCSHPPAPTKPVNAVAGPIQDGLYGVVGDAATAEEAKGGNADCTVLAYKNLAAESEPIRYIAIDTASFVPLEIEGEPDAQKDNEGKTILSVTLKSQYIGELKKFSKAHMGGKIAILLDGEIVTVHKVRSVISDGKFQLSRCTDNACEVLRGKLKR